MRIARRRAERDARRARWVEKRAHLRGPSRALRLQQPVPALGLGRHDASRATRVSKCANERSVASLGFLDRIDRAHGLERSLWGNQRCRRPRGRAHSPARAHRTPRAAHAMFSPSRAGDRTPTSSVGRARRDDAEDGAAAVASRSERDARGDDDDDDADAVDRGARDDAERRVEPRDAADARASRGAPVRAARALARVRREQVRPRPRSRVRARARDRPSRVGRARVRIVRGSVRERERDGTRVRGDDHRAPARRARGWGDYDHRLKLFAWIKAHLEVRGVVVARFRRFRHSCRSGSCRISFRLARARLDRRLAALERADVRLRPDTRAA